MKGALVLLAAQIWVASLMVLIAKFPKGPWYVVLPWFGTWISSAVLGGVIRALMAEEASA